jgi:hypothetical protein
MKIPPFLKTNKIIMKIEKQKLVIYKKIAMNHPFHMQNYTYFLFKIDLYF